jgi:hypothetical protein
MTEIVEKDTLLFKIEKVSEAESITVEKNEQNLPEQSSLLILDQKQSDCQSKNSDKETSADESSPIKPDENSNKQKQMTY